MILGLAIAGTAEVGRVNVLGRLAGDSSVTVEAFLRLCTSEGREVLEALERESRSLWNLRLVVLRATAMMVMEVQCTMT